MPSVAVAATRSSSAPASASGSSCDGGSGDDTLVYLGSGNASLYGDGGDDYLEVGPAATGTVLLDGGDDNDFLVHNGLGAATLRGGTGNDNLYGGPQADTLLGGDEACPAGSEPCGGDEIDGRGGLDTIDAGAGDDLIRITVPSTVGQPVVQGGAGTDFIAVKATTGPDSLVIRRPTGIPTADIEIAQTGAGAPYLRANGIETIVIDLGAGADVLTIESLNGTGVKTVIVDAGRTVTDTGQTVLVTDADNPDIKISQPVFLYANDGATDVITIKGRDAVADQFTIAGVTDVNGRNTEIRVVHAGVSDVYLQHTVRGEGDRLIVEGLTGNDTLDATALGDDDPAAAPEFADLVALELRGGEGNDRLIGSPFADHLDSGLGDDIVTGGTGLDTFADAGGTDTLMETQDDDMSLYEDTFVVGALLAENGSPFANTGFKTEAQLIDEFRTLDNPNLRTTDNGDRYAAGATVESINGLFEKAILTGGNRNNTLVVNDSDNTVYIGGVARSVTPWDGRATLDARGNDVNQFPEHYVITITLDNIARIDIVDSGGGSGVDMVVILGTNQGDDLALNAGGSGSFRVGFVRAREVSQTIVTFRAVERVQVFTLGGSDRVLVDDTAVLTTIDMGGGDDELIVGTVPLIPDTGQPDARVPRRRARGRHREHDERQHRAAVRPRRRPERPLRGQPQPRASSTSTAATATTASCSRPSSC